MISPPAGTPPCGTGSGRSSRRSADGTSKSTRRSSRTAGLANSPTAAPDPRTITPEEVHRRGTPTEPTPMSARDPEDAVLRQQLFGFVESRQTRRPHVDVAGRSQRNILRHATEPQIGRVHPCAGHTLVEPPSASHAPRTPTAAASTRRRPGRARDVEWFRGARDLGKSMRIRCPRLGRSRLSIFSTASEKHVPCSSADVVEPVEIGDRLQVGPVLDQLLGAAMQKADVRIAAR